MNFFTRIFKTLGDTKAESLYFDIHLNRNELADFLFVDRSALSRELGRMRNEGIMGFNKERFTITALAALMC